MSAAFDDGSPPVPTLKEQFRPPRTALAFALAPGIAALIGAVVFTTSASAGGPPGSSTAFLAVTLGIAAVVGLFGYISMGLFAAPLYAVLPDGVRSEAAAVIPLAGTSAAAPWLLLSLFGGAPLLIGAAVAFALGCVAGVAFVLIRGAVPGAAEGGTP